MTTWTIIATLITGAVLGIALMCGIIFLAIRSDERVKKVRAAKAAQRARDEELVRHYESTIHDH